MALSLVDLPDEIIMNIVSYLGFYIDDIEEDYYYTNAKDGVRYPYAALLYATCKIFNFLKQYRYSYTKNSQNIMVIITQLTSAVFTMVQCIAP